MTSELRRRVAERDAVWRRARRASAPAEVREDATRVDRELKKAIKVARRAYIRSHWDRDSGSSKRQWRLLNNLTGRKPSSRPEPSASPDDVNQAFAKKVADISARLHDGPLPLFADLEPDQPRLRTFAPITADDVAAVLRVVRPSAAAAEGDVPMSVLVRAAPQLTRHIARLANAVLVAGWPARWKDAEVSPLWKGRGSREDAGTYRPVSLLPASARLVERLILPQLLAHFSKIGLLPPAQHGFRPGHSCESALAHMLEAVAQARGRGEVVLVASFDAQAAFDTLSHDILLQKLRRTAGVEGPALEVLRSYLTGRRQCCRMAGDRRSSWLPVLSGTPQGAVLSPLLWAAAIADLPQHITTGEVVCYADDWGE
jgi:hypothetical protein